MGKISVLINVVSEEAGVLPRVLDSIKGIASEIVLVDMTPGEEIRKIAGKYGAKIYKHELVPYVEPVRNFGISKANEDWILILDPDEEISSSLAEKIKTISEKGKGDYFRIPRKNIIFGKWIKHSRWWPDYNIRFFKKGSVSWNEVIHSVPLTQGEGADLEAKEEHAIVHHHYASISQYIERANRYSDAQSRGQEFEWKNLIIGPIQEFLSRYFQGEGYKDGIHGLALCLLQGFSALLVQLKIWERKKFEEKQIKVDEVVETLKQAQKETSYWLADTLIKNGAGILQRIKRKLKL